MSMPNSRCVIFDHDPTHRFTVISSDDLYRLTQLGHVRRLGSYLWGVDLSQAEAVAILQAPVADPAVRKPPRSPGRPRRQPRPEA